MPKRTAAVGAALAALVVAAGAGTASAAATWVLPTPYDPTRPAEQRPEAVQFLMTGGDWMTGLHWRSWGGKRAVATGTAHIRHCDPNCAQGFAEDLPGRLVLSGVCTRGGRRYYTRGAYTYKRGRRTISSAALGQPGCPQS
jgi:hypothetical protein